jgi:hypothetical protein
MNATDRARDSIGSHALAIASLREIAIRRGRIKPEKLHEFRWKKEGPKGSNAELDTVKYREIPFTD